jgi:glycosyltransferase involved in cell wall biosynthesis
MSLVSIITINYNNAKGLETTLESVCNQKNKDYELIIIDGKSTDHSLSIIDKYQSIITYSCSEKDDGVYDAMNKGIKKASGNFLIFMNSGDSFYDNDTLTTFSDLKILHSKFDIIYGDVNAVDMTMHKKIMQSKKLNLFYFIDHTLNHQATFIKRELFEKYGLYSLEYKISSDYEFFLKAFLDNDTRFIHHDFTVCNFQLDGMSQNPINFDDVTKERLIIQKKHIPAKELNYYLKLKDKKKLSKTSIIVWLRKYYVTRQFFNSAFFIYTKLK